MKNRKLFISIMAAFLALIMVLGLVVGIIPQAADAASLSELEQELADLKSQKAEINKEIASLEGKVSENASKMEKVVAQKNAIDQEIFMIYQKIEVINEQITTYGVLIGEKQKELEDAEARLAELNRQNKERIRAMEENGQISYWSVLFKANSFTDLLDRINMVNEIAASDKRRLDELNEAAEAVRVVKKELQEEMAALEETKVELTESEAELEKKRVEAERLLSELIATGAEFQALIDAAEEEVGKLGAQISSVQKEYNAEKYEQWLSTSVPPSTSSGKPSGGSSSSGGGTTNNAPSSSGWLVPCKYTAFTSPYGWRIHPVYGTRKFHYGVDLAAPRGTPIKASRAGTVAAASYSSGAGYYVNLDHGDGFVSQYYHMTHYIVKAGQKVSAGQTIGYVGSTGASTGNHLHFGITYKGSYVNPAKYINI